MATTFKLPKVTEYVKNVGKSIAFASIDAVKEQTPGIKDFIDTNEDIFKEVYSSVKNFRSTIKNTEKSIKQSNAYQAVEIGIKNMIEDAKTGKFYNDRTSEVGEQALGMDMFDDEDFSFSDSSSSSGSSSSDSFSDAIGAAATSQATIIAQSTDMMVRSNKASTKLIMAHMDRTNAALTSSIGSVYSAISGTNAFLNGPMRAHMENSRRYYEESLKSTNEINMMLKEMLEMQRNLYKAEGAKQKESKLDQSMGYDGSVDIRGYAKNIKSNVESIADELGLSALKMDMGGGNPYLLYAAAPFKLIMGPMMDRLMSKDFKKALASFDKGVTTMFSQLVARMNTAKNRNDGSFMSILGKLFGVDIDVKDNINASNYKKDAVPFDGITRQSIIETIPGYLARIEAALTGGGERHYDFQSGTWKGARQIEKEYDDRRKRAITSANYGAMSEFESMLSKLEAQGDKGKKKADSLRKQGHRAYQKLFDMGGDFRPQGMKDEFGDFIEGWELYGFKSKKDFDAWYKSHSKKSIREFASNNMRGRQNLSREIRREEEMGGAGRHLFNGAYDMAGTGDGKRHNPSAYKGAGTGLLATSFDKSGRNVFWYLNNILEGIRDFSRKFKPSSSGRTYSRSNNRARRVKTKQSSSSSSSGSEDPDGESDSNDETYEAYYREEQERLERERQESSKKSLVGDWINKKFGDSKIGKSLANILGGAEKFFAKPMEYMTNLLNKADESMFSMMFGEKKVVDENGEEIHGIFPYMIYKVKTAFKDLYDHIKELFNPLKERFKEWFKPKWEQYGKPVVDEMKGIAKAGWDRVKTGVGNTFGKGFQTVKDKVKSGMVATADEVSGTASIEDKQDPGIVPIVESAYGRYVTKRGLTMISPGEMIIPASFDKNEQRKMLALEKRDRNRISNAIGLHAAGTVDTNEMKSNLQKIYEENKGNGAKNIASGIMGAGAGLLLGNPLLGAMAGAGLSILKNSETFNNVIFGKEMEDGSREGGLVPKKIQDFFKKALPDMGDFGIAGGLLGLITPFGPLGGAAIGAGIGALKNSEGFKKFIFGDEETGKDGLISKESAKKAKEFLLKAAPKAAIGAIAGVLTGPFGLIGNAALGAGAGMIASTSTFEKLLFGEKDKDGKRGTGGIFGAISRGILDPAKEKIGEILENFKGYTKKHIFEPLKNFWEPFQQYLKNTITGVGEKVKDFLNDMFEKKVGLPIYDFLQEKIFKPLTKTFFNILKAPINLAKMVVAAPFKMLGGIGNSMRMSQIRRGTAYDMSASERLAWRGEHKGRAGFRRMFGKDKMEEQDELLANMTEQQLRELATNSRAGVESLESLQKSKTKATDAVKNEFSKFFNDKKTTPDKKTRYSRANYKEVNKVLEKIQTDKNADVRAEINSIKGLTDDEKKQLFDLVSDKISEVRSATETYELAKNGTESTDEALSKLLGHKVGNRKQRRQIYKSAEAELKHRLSAKSAEEAGSGTGEESDTEVGAVKDLTNKYETKTNSIIDLLKGLNDKIAIYTGIRDRTVSKEAYKKFNSEERRKASGITQEEIEKNIAESRARKAAKTNAAVAMEDIYSYSQDGKDTGNAFTNFLGKLNPFKKKKVHEDSKEAVDARKDAAEDEADEKSANDAERESAGWLKKLYDKAFGDKEKDKKEGGGLFGKIGNLFGGIFDFFTGGSFASKLGLGALAIGGVSLFGHMSNWFKDKFWPKLKEIIFGEDGSPDGDDGLWGHFKQTKIGRALDTFFGGIQESGGVKAWVADKLLPNVINNLVAGIGYSMEHIVAPLIVAVVKNLPSLLASVVKGLINGLTSAIFKKEIKRDGDNTIGVDTSEFATIHSSANNKMSNYVSSDIKSMFNGQVSSGVTKASFDWSTIGDSNNASADSTYDANGNHLNKTGNEILWEKESGLAGLLGKKKLTNDIYYNEDGSIGLNAYYQMNDADSLASTVTESAGRGFVQGSLGFRNPLFSKAAGMKVKGSGKGLFGNGKGIFGNVKTGVKAGVKGGASTVDGANKAGLNLFQIGAKNQRKFDFIDDVIKAKGVSGAEAKALRKELEDKVLSGKFLDPETGNSILDDVFGSTFDTPDSLKTKLGEIVSDANVTTNSGKLANAIKSKWKNSKLGTKVDDIATKVKNSSVAQGIRSVKDSISEAAENVATKKANVTTKIKGAVKDKILDPAKQKVKSGATKVGAGIKEAAGKAVTKAKDTKVGKAVAKAADEAKDIISKIGSKIKSVFSGLAENEKIMKFFKKAAKEGTDSGTLKKAIIKIGDKIADSALGKVGKKVLSKITAGLAKFAIPLLIAQCVISFLWGYDNADTILGVAKGDTYEINFGQKVVCGLVHLVNEQLLLGLIPTETIMDIVIEFLFPIFGIDAEELNAARDRADQILDEWNAAHPEETYSNLEDFNNKDKITTKIKKGAKKLLTKAGEGIKKGWEKTKEGAKKTWNNIKESKFGQAVGAGFNKVKEWGGQAVDFVKNGFAAIGDKVKEGFGKVTDVGKFIKDIVANTLKAATDPEYKWDIDSYITEDDPLAGAKKTVYNVMKIPLTVIGLVAKVGKSIFDKIKGFAVGVKDGFKDAWKDIAAVGKGEYTVFHKDYWKFNDSEDKKDGENPLGVIGKVASTILKVLSAPQAMLGWTGTKIWEGMKKLVSGAKEGILDASTDVKNVRKGQYTIFNKNYWKSDKNAGDNQLSLLGSIFGFISRVFQAPGAMLGWVGTKVWTALKTLINGAKEGILDASTDVEAVKKGEYTIFNKNYWKSEEDPDNLLSKLGSIFGFVSRVFQAPSAMLGWVGTKVKAIFNKIVNDAKEGALDASTDVDAVKKGEYTIFNKKYWTSEDDGDNPLSKLGNVFGFVTRLTQAPMAMLGWVGTKVKEVFTKIVNGAKEGAMDASKDVDAVKKGEYTIFNKKYWTSEDDEDNPLSKLGSVFGFVTRLSQAPMAMLGYTFTKVKEGFEKIINGVKDLQEENDKVFKKVEDGNLSIFDKEYWKVTVDEDNPLGVLGKVFSFIERLVKAPILLIKGVFGKIGDMFSGILDFLGLDSLDQMTGGKVDGKVEGEGRRGRGRNKYGISGMGHVYQSDSIIANMPYGDSTIGKSGCAPVAATNLINNINPNTMDVKRAAAFAEKNGLIVRGGGTDVRYFNQFLGSQGIGTINTRNKDAVIAALKNGHQVIMLGQDGSNAPGMPFGTNPHYITATGIDKNGNIIVQDPDLPQSSVVYKKNKLLNSMSTSIITDGSKIRSKKGQTHGLGRRLWWGGTGDEEAKEVSVENLMSELGNLGTNAIKAVFGSAYDALYGSEDSYSSGSTSSGSTSTASINLSGNSNAEKIWNYLISQGYSKAGAAGLMGNLWAESGLNPKNIQQSYESKYGTDDAYTSAVDSKSRGKESFAKDSAGYGLAQWTYHTRKRGLYEATVEQGKSIADLAGQLSYLDSELQKYTDLYKTLKSTTSVNTASDRVLSEFERPAVLNYDARRGFSNSMYSQFSGSGRAAAALNSYGNYNNYYGGARVDDRANSTNAVDYATFLKTIVTLLTNISGNTAILSKILELLSEHFNITINKSEIQEAVNTASRESTMAALNDLVQRNGGNSSSVSKLLNTQDTDYIFAAMAALAKE